MILNPFIFGGGGGGPPAPDGANVLVDQFIVETMLSKPSNAIVTQFVVEVMVKRADTARVSGIFIEVLEKVVNVRVDQFVVEVMKPVIPAIASSAVVNGIFLEVLEYECAASAGGPPVGSGDGIRNSGNDLGNGQYFFSLAHPDNSSSNPYPVQPLTLQDALAQALAGAQAFFPPFNGAIISDARLAAAYNVGGGSVLIIATSSEGPDRLIGEWIWDNVDRNTIPPDPDVTCGPQGQVTGLFLEVLETTGTTASDGASHLTGLFLEVLTPTLNTDLHGGVT